MQNGWIKLYRVLLDKYIWLDSTPEQKVILVTLLLMANHEPFKWQWRGAEYEVKPGQFITSVKSIVHKCGKGISTQNVRTALKRFEKLDFLTIEPTNENSLVTITNWELYQPKEEKVTNELTETQQGGNKGVTTNKNDKNDKNNDTNVSMSIASQSTETINYDEVVNFFNSKTKGVFGKVRLPINDNRKKAIRARIREHGKVAFGEVVAKATQSDFLKGSTNFKATFDWMIKPGNFQKILEGNYDNRIKNEKEYGNEKQQQREGFVKDVQDGLLQELLNG